MIVCFGGQAVRKAIRQAERKEGREKRRQTD